ncbi:TPA: DUF1761 domain-containing protein [Candidatus Woesearchaeota archaeon]|nr:DUF1761 domain-containing protein [Candidatus Woesearchaeota archaeon]
MNYLAVIVAAIAGMAFGGLWYAPFAFGKLWSRLSRVRNPKHEWWDWALGSLTSLIMAYVLALFVSGSGVIDGILTGALLWLGFVATFSFGEVIWDKKPFNLWLLNNAYNLLVLIIMGAIIGSW